jgi:hypothetical protein
VRSSRDLVSGPEPAPPQQPFWRQYGILSIVVAIIGAAGVILAAVISSDGGSGGGGTTSTPPAKTPPAAQGLTLLSPEDIRVRASSILASQDGNTYVATNTIDGDPQTAWSEGRDGPGIGAAITWTFKRRVDLQRMAVVNGYSKGDLFIKNLRIRNASVTTAQGETTATLRDTSDYQRIRIRTGETDFVRLQILGVYGSRVYEDCLLSEAEFYYRSA